MRARDEATIREAASWWKRNLISALLRPADKTWEIEDGRKLIFSLLMLLGFHWSEAQNLIREIRGDA